MESLTSLLSWLTWDRAFLSVLSFSSLVLVCEATGLLPPSWSRRLNRNQATRTIDVLQELGVDIPKLRQRNAASGIMANVQGRTLEERVRKRLARATIEGPFNVGSTRPLPANSFIDAMGACTNPASAQALAGDLFAHWGNLLRDPSSGIQSDVEFVVTPKYGCPMLGYEFAKLMKKPFVVYNGSPKFAGPQSNFRADFDCEAQPRAGSRALLVDDSSTGGAKASATVAALQQAGYAVSDFIVLFEPMLKEHEGANAASRLGQQGVSLRSIFKS